MALHEGVNFSRNQKRGVWVLGILILTGILLESIWTKYNPPSSLENLSSLQLPPKPSPNSEYSPIDINIADSLDWVKLKGIGPVLTGRILKFRSNEMGFGSVEQVGQTYGLDSMTFSSLKHLLIFRDSTYLELKKAIRNSVVPIHINEATPKEWQRLPGIGSVLSKRIVAYRTRLGGLQSHLDLKNVYGLPEETYLSILPFLRPLSKEQTKPSNNPPQTKLALRSIELNQSDSLLLSNIPNVSPRLASRIVRYRNLLGFFYKTDQLKAVYGLDAAAYQSLNAYAYIDSLATYPRKSLNRASREQIALLPALDQSMTSAIVQLRTQLGRLESWGEVEVLSELSVEALDELQIYFEL